MLAPLINTAQWLNLKKYLANLTVNTSHIQGPSSKCRVVCIYTD